MKDKEMDNSELEDPSLNELPQEFAEAAEEVEDNINEYNVPPLHIPAEEFRSLEPLYSKFDVIKWQEKRIKDMNEEHERLNPTVKRVRDRETNRPRIRNKKSDMKPGIE